jgi:type II secretory pathway predicted ATPase ExeA
MKKRTICSDQSFIKYKAATSYYLSSCQQEVYQSLITGFREEKILFSITGESGLGKSYLMECITNELADNARVVKISQRSGLELFDVIIEQLGIDVSKEPAITDKKSWLIRYFRRQLEQHIIIQVEHAQLLTLDSLSSIIDWVKLISAEKNHFPSIHIVLLGLPSLPLFFELDDKIFCQCQLKTLSDDEIPKYIHSYLERLDKVENLFEYSALERIVFYSEGIPRLINKLCDLGLLTAQLEEIPSITAAVIDEVAGNCLFIHKTDTSPENRKTKQMPSLSKTNTSIEVITDSKYELKDRNKIIKEADNSSIDCISILTRKIFIFGLAVGLLFGVGGSVFLNQGWLNNKNMRQQPLQNLIVTAPQVTNDDELQFIDKQKMLAPSDSVGLSERIGELFNQAERQLANKQLMTPVDDNALTTYHEILGLDENNKKALIGISSISKIFHGFNVTTPQVIIDDETQNSKLNSDDDLQIVDKQ